MAGLFGKFAYFNLNDWIPLLTLSDRFLQDENLERYAASFCTFALMDENSFYDMKKKLESLLGLTDTASNRGLVPEYVNDNAYFVQAAMELGYIQYDWSDLQQAGFLSEEEVEDLKAMDGVESFLDTYGLTYDNGALMNGFITFLQENSTKDKCRMLFIYGENDPWTGGAIPDSVVDGTYIKKIIAKKGLHSQSINNVSHYAKEDREAILDAINTLLGE